MILMITFKISTCAMHKTTKSNLVSRATLETWLIILYNVIQLRKKTLPASFDFRKVDPEPFHFLPKNNDSKCLVIPFFG